MLIGPTEETVLRSKIKRNAAIDCLRLADTDINIPWPQNEVSRIVTEIGAFFFHFLLCTINRKWGTSWILIVGPNGKDPNDYKVVSNQYYNRNPKPGFRKFYDAAIAGKVFIDDVASTLEGIAKLIARLTNTQVTHS